jgi:hypothetical protein
MIDEPVPTMPASVPAIRPTVRTKSKPNGTHLREIKVCWSPHVIARSESDEAIQTVSVDAIWIASLSLAMTSEMVIRLVNRESPATRKSRVSRDLILRI